MSDQQENYLDARGAARLAERIAAYWRERGHTGVRVWRYELPGVVDVFGIRSNLCAGLPPAVMGAALCGNPP